MRHGFFRTPFFVETCAVSHRFLRLANDHRGSIERRRPLNNRELHFGKGGGIRCVLAVSFRVDRSSYSTCMCILSIWVSPEVLAYGLSGFPGSCSMNARLPGIVFSILGFRRFEGCGTSSRWHGFSMCKPVLIHLPLCKCEKGGITVVLITNRPDNNNKTSGDSVYFLKHPSRSLSRTWFETLDPDLVSHSLRS